jgi:predicted nucleotidyltransferase
MRTQIERTVARMVRRIVERFSPDKVILFGSHATGRAGPDSDIDLLVVMRYRGTRSRTELMLRAALRGFRVPKDIVVTTPYAYEWRKQVPGTSERPAAREGRVVFEKT